MYAVQVAPTPVAVPTRTEPHGVVNGPMSRVPIASLLDADDVRVATFVENGRTYFNWQNGTYYFPYDDEESIRLDFLHALIYYHAFNGQLHYVHLPEPPKRVLDLGSGSGFWMVDMAKRYENATIIGFDIVPPFSSGVTGVERTMFCSPVDFTSPRWPVEDASIDFIHMAQLCGSVSDWESLYRTAIRALRPGKGVIEHIEIDWTPRSSKSPFPPQAESLLQWWTMTKHASEEARRPLTYREDTEALLERAGFVDISHLRIKVPMYKDGVADEQEWRLAADYQMTMGHIGSKNFEAFSMALLTRHLKWTPERTEEMCSRALKTTCIKFLPLYMNLHVWSARRPMS